MKKIAIMLFVGVAAVGAGCGDSNKNKKVELWPDIDMRHLDEKVGKMFEGPTVEEKVRHQIAQVLKAGDEARALRETAALWDLAKELNWDGRRLLTAVLDYCSQLKNDEEQVARYQRLLERLDAPKTSVVDAAGERLEHAEGRTDEVARNLLRHAIAIDPRERRASYANFTHFLETRQSQPPKKLVLWMYETDPGAAMLEMLSVFGKEVSRDEAKLILLAERTVNDGVWKQQQKLTGEKIDERAVEALGMLARLRPWWVRLYVAKMAARNPGLRTEAMMQRLGEDENELVKQTVGKVR